MNNKFKHPFSTPDDYFEKLKENILKNTSESAFNKVDKKNIYTVPEGFFEDQYGSILDKKGSPIENTFKAGQSLAWATLAIAACLFVIFTYSYFDTDEINEILSKEGQIIQSDISDLPASNPANATKDMIKKDSLSKIIK